MFCKNCGKELANDVKFCDACGATVAAETAAPVQQAPVQQVPVQQVPVQPGAQVVYVVKQPSPTIANFVNVVKSVWAKPTETVQNVAKSNTHEWSLFALIAMVAHALGAAVVGLEMLNQFFSSMADGEDVSEVVGEIYPFFGIFGVGLLIGLASFFVTALGIWILVAAVLKKPATFVQVMNLTAVATLPLSLIGIANMLFGLIFSPITIALFIAAFAMCVVLLYIGVQSYDDLGKVSFYGFTATIAIIVFVVFLLGLIYWPVLKDGISDSMLGMF